MNSTAKVRAFRHSAKLLILHSLCKVFAKCLHYGLCAYGKDEFVPFLSAALAVEHLFI